MLDHFLAGLVVDVCHQVLESDLQDFEHAALLAERVAGTGGEAPHGLGAYGSSSSSQKEPTDLGVMYGPSP